MIESRMNVAIYARVSTTDQDCGVQLDELRAYCGRRSWTVYREYVDAGFSGAKASRPALDNLMLDAAKHHFDCVVVLKLDRFGRSVLHLSQGLATLERHGVRFIAVSQGIDTDASNPASRLMMTILAGVAEFEREIIRERVVAGIAGARRKGKTLGRRKVVFDRSKAEELQRRGASLREIAATLKVGRGTIQRLLAQK